MNYVTVALFVKPSDLLKLSEVLQVLKPLQIDNDYSFQPKDIEYSSLMISNYVQVNIPIRLFLKFEYCYKKLKNKAKVNR